MSKVRNVDVNVVSGTLKLYLRELPEPLIPAVYFQSLSKAMGEFLALSFRQSLSLSLSLVRSYMHKLTQCVCQSDLTDPNLRVSTMLSELQSFPDVNRNTLLFLLHHLKR